MLPIHQLALYVHIVVGACALILFWIPVFARKGNLDHKRFGRYFALAMYTIACSGLIMSSLDLLFPLAMHAADLELDAAEAQRATTEVRLFGLFLFSLSILVLTSTRHGWLTILCKEDRTRLRQPLHLALNLALLAIGLILLGVGLQTGNVLFMVFGILQSTTATGNFRYIFRAQLRPKEWWLQHLSGLIGSGIGAYTAFTVFGGRRFFEEIFSSNFDSVSIYLWTMPGLVGGVTITLLSRHYKKRFGGEWMIRRMWIRSELGK